MAGVKLDRDSIQSLKTAQRQIHDLLPEFDKAEECGIDCQEYRSVAEVATEQISKMIKNYGTG